MSMSFVSLYRRVISRPLESIFQKQQTAPPRDDPERLERIATYACAGYFSMGYTLEMFHVIGEVAPE